MPSSGMSVARAGRYVDSFSNPAALPFRSSGDGAFMLATGYGDEADHALYDDRLGFFQDSESSLTLSFGGRNAMFTLGVGYGLDRLQEQVPVYDMLFRMYFQMDLAYGFGPFSFAARLQGGNSMIRSGRSVDSMLDFATNMFFSQFYENPGSEYFQVGAGLMWYDEDYFTLGLYIDNFVGTYGGETTFSWSDMADSLSVGASVYLPRFDRAGDLNLVRPFLTLQFGDVASSASYILASFELRFQLLPRYDVSLTASLLSFRDANVSYMRSTRNLTLFSLEFLLDNWTISASAEIPFSYYTGQGGQDSFALSIGLRYKPS